MHGLHVKKRAAFLFLLMLGCLVMLCGRLVHVQAIWAPWLQRQAETQRLHQVPVDAHRGSILDRASRELAASSDADCVGATPAEIANPGRTAAILAPMLHMDATGLEYKLRLKQAFVWLKRRVPRAEARAVKEAHLPGLLVLPKAQRFYPTDLAGQVLGFVGSDNQGLEGLELYYDAHLRGRNGWDMAEFSALGSHIPGGERCFEPPVDGETLVVTIDEGMQFIVERELDQAMGETGAKRGLAIFMDPRTGEILAMANRPRIDPALFLSFPQETWKNICVTDQFEPGSTLKIVTASAALEEGVVKPDSRFFDPGFLTVDDRHLHCWLPGGHGSQSFTEAFENSCNPVFASLALALGAQRFQRYARAFGLGARTGIDFPGEAVGMVPRVTGMKRVELATMGFGQGISVTPLQLITAAAVIANGGFLIQPHLLKELRDLQGNIILRGRTEVVRQVLSRQTAATMRMLLESVVVNGSGNRAGVPGYRIAGKTGTAQKPSPGGGYGNEVVASFVGFAPAENPCLAGLILLDEPSCGVRYGGVIVAPVFSRIMGSILRNLRIPAQAGGAKNAGRGTAMVPNVLNMPLDEAKAALTRAGLAARPLGRGSCVFDQVPKPGAGVRPGTPVLLYFDPAEKYNRFVEELVAVPDLSGLRRDVTTKILTELGLRSVLVGDGVVRAQEPKPGTKVRLGTTITVRFSPPEERP